VKVLAFLDSRARVPAISLRNVELQKPLGLLAQRLQEFDSALLESVAGHAGNGRIMNPIRIVVKADFAHSQVRARCLTKLSLPFSSSAL